MEKDYKKEPRKNKVRINKKYLNRIEKIESRLEGIFEKVSKQNEKITFDLEIG